MEPNILIPAIAALGGTLIGGLITFLSSYILKKAEWEKETRIEQIKKREDLYSEYITECSRLLMTRIDTPLKSTSEMVLVSSLFARIRIYSTPPVEQAANNLMKEILSTNKAEEESKETKSSYLQFSKACRVELEELLTK